MNKYDWLTAGVLLLMASPVLGAIYVVAHFIIKYW